MIRHLPLCSSRNAQLSQGPFSFSLDTYGASPSTTFSSVKTLPSSRCTLGAPHPLPSLIHSPQQCVETGIKLLSIARLHDFTVSHSWKTEGLGFYFRFVFGKHRSSLLYILQSTYHRTFFLLLNNCLLKQKILFVNPQGLLL